jgi:hypothetical protein
MAPRLRDLPPEPLTRVNPDEPDYLLNTDSCWITVGTVAIWIRNIGDAVVIETYRNGHEANTNPLSLSCVNF